MCIHIIKHIKNSAGIMRTVQDSQKQAENSLSQAFQDLDALIKKAAEMVCLSRTADDYLSSV